MYIYTPGMYDTAPPCTPWTLTWSAAAHFDLLCVRDVAPTDLTNGPGKAREGFPGHARRECATSAQHCGRRHRCHQERAGALEAGVQQRSPGLGLQDAQNRVWTPRTGWPQVAPGSWSPVSTCTRKPPSPS